MNTQLAVYLHTLIGSKRQPHCSKGPRSKNDLIGAEILASTSQQPGHTKSNTIPKPTSPPDTNCTYNVLVTTSLRPFYYCCLSSELEVLVRAVIGQDTTVFSTSGCFGKHIDGASPHKSSRVTHNFAVTHPHVGSQLGLCQFC